MIDIYPRTWGK